MFGSKLKKELEQATDPIDQFADSAKNLTLDAMNEAPVKEQEPQTKLSQKQIEKSLEIYLKPKRTISVKDKFNENYRSHYEYDKEYVQFIAENKELIGCPIEMWTKPYAGIPAEFWEVPVNKPIWGPRYLAEQIKRCNFHRLSINNQPVNATAEGTFYGTMVAESTVQRLDALPVANKKSMFMGGNFK